MRPLQCPRSPQTLRGCLLTDLMQVLDTLALNCSPAIRTQLGHKRFLQPVTALAADKRQGPCSEAAMQLLVDWAFMYKCAAIPPWVFGLLRVPQSWQPSAGV